MAENNKPKRRNYSFSIKKTDSPVIEKFLNAQTNYSESLRYLILKFCRENGVKDISYMLNSYIMFPDEFRDGLIREERNRIVEEPMQKHIYQEEIVQNNNINRSIEDQEKFENDKELEEVEIPDCYD